MKTKFWVSVLAVLALVFVVCGEKQPEQTSVEQAPFDADSLLPASAGGYTMASSIAKQTPEEVKSFVGEDLAATMEQYSLVGLAAGLYKGGRFALTAQILQFLQPLDAFGYYSIERPDGADTTSLGTEGYLSGRTFKFTQSNYVVTLSSGDLGDSTLQNILPVAITISAAIGSSPPLPEQFGLFPEKNEVVPSNRYFAGRFLEIDDITGVFTVDYFLSGDSLRLFLTDDGAGTKLAALVKASGQTMESSPAPPDFVFDNGYGILFDQEPYGMILAGLKEGRLIGAIGYNPEKDAQFVSEWVNGFTGLAGKQ